MKSLFISAAILSIAGSTALAQSPAPPANQTAPQPAMEQPAFPITLESLRAVQDAHERIIKWRQSADEAVARIKDPKLRDQVNQRLTDVATEAAADLLGKPGQNAIATIAVFKDAKTDTQVMAAVSYDGRGDTLNQTFFPRLLADLPAPTARPTESKLEMDVTATSYLCFFLDHGDLLAGNVPHAVMKKSLSLAIQNAREKGGGLAATVGANGAAAQIQQARDAQRDELDRRVREARAQQQAADTAAQTTNNAYNSDGSYVNNSASPNYPNGPYGYGGNGYWNPWVAYIPATGDTPVVVAPQRTVKNERIAPGKPLLPGTVVARDPKTGQPLPPTRYNADGTPIKSFPANQTPANGVTNQPVQSGTANGGAAAQPAAQTNQPAAKNPAVGVVAPIAPVQRPTAEREVRQAPGAVREERKEPAAQRPAPVQHEPPAPQHETTPAPKEAPVQHAPPPTPAPAAKPAVPAEAPAKK